MTIEENIRKCRAWDQRRQGVPGEHTLAALAGGALIAAALVAPSPLRATLRALLGGALLVRAATGRDGLACLQGTPVSSADRPWLFPRSSDRAGPSA